MRTAHRKDVLTTGEVARICHVAPRTVSKWFDTGELRGYRIPGSRDRRIPIDQLVAFMRVHGIPLSALDGGTCRILFIGGAAGGDLVAQAQQSNRHEISFAANGFEAGVLAQQARPHVVVLDVGADAQEAIHICRNIKSSASFGAAKVIAASETQPEGRSWESQGFDGWIMKPFSYVQLAQVVERITNLAS